MGGVLITSGRTDVADVPAVLYGVEEAAAALRLSRSVLYELIRSGQLRTVKQGASPPGAGVRSEWCDDHGSPLWFVGRCRAAEAVAADGIKSPQR